MKKLHYQIQLEKYLKENGLVIQAVGSQIWIEINSYAWRLPKGCPFPRETGQERFEGVL
jgi:hypothetical protein